MSTLGYSVANQGLAVLTVAAALLAENTNVEIRNKSLVLRQVRLRHIYRHAHVLTAG